MYPKIVILAQGGSHGDFLSELLKISNGQKGAEISESGQVLSGSMIKVMNKKAFTKPGLPADLPTDLQDKNKEKYVMCHVWHEHMSDWPSDFYYIHMQPDQISTVITMLIDKVFNGNVEAFLNHWKKEYPEKVSRYITTKTYLDIYTKLYLNLQKKFKTNAKKIQMTDLYDYDKVLKFLHDACDWNGQNLTKINAFYNNWFSKNTKYIKKIIHK